MVNGLLYIKTIGTRPAFDFGGNGETGWNNRTATRSLAVEVYEDQDTKPLVALLPEPGLRYRY